MQLEQLKAFIPHIYANEIETAVQRVLPQDPNTMSSTHEVVANMFGSVISRQVVQKKLNEVDKQISQSCTDKILLRIHTILNGCFQETTPQGQSK